ncbi:hypothetical protein J4760_04115 [Salinicoccus sp. ID82-1]|uniref:hypothetical protein n=1 Tax=Salinicoccus sp. ID82-1 TaxID=2820269 RepID=UPI001F3DDCC1|nr:hypothetical protein [Salinicoccus sp. ID82-1]MCG1009237.1 hypothetical protein [Salinicoccus sp. ID82-1]
MNRDKSNNKMHNPLLVIAVVVITLALFGAAFLPKLADLIKSEYLITAAAIIPLLYTTVAQHVELGYQRKELKESTEALQGQQKELNETKEINDKHQINNQFFQLIGLRERYVNETYTVNDVPLERSDDISYLYQSISRHYRAKMLRRFINHLDDEKIKNYHNQFTDSNANEEELMTVLSYLIDYYDPYLDHFKKREEINGVDEENGKEFIKSFKLFVDSEDIDKMLLEKSILFVESVKKVNNKYYGYHLTVIAFLQNLGYVNLKKQLEEIYISLLTTPEKYYFGIKSMSRPASTYLFQPTSDNKAREEAYKNDILYM